MCKYARRCVCVDVWGSVALDVRVWGTTRFVSRVVDIKVIKYNHR